MFGLIGQGLATSEIAQRLCLDPEAVRTDRRQIREKLRLESGPALVAYAVRWATTQALN